MPRQNAAQCDAPQPWKRTGGACLASGSVDVDTRQLELRTAILSSRCFTNNHTLCGTFALKHRLTPTLLSDIRASGCSRMLTDRRARSFYFSLCCQPYRTDCLRTRESDNNRSYLQRARYRLLKNFYHRTLRNRMTISGVIETKRRRACDMLPFLLCFRIVSAPAD